MHMQQLDHPLQLRLSFRSVAGEGNEMCDREVCGTAPPIQHLSRNDTSVNRYVALRNVRKALVRNSEVGKTLLCVSVFCLFGQLALRASCGAIITVTFTLMSSIIIIITIIIISEGSNSEFAFVLSFVVAPRS